MFKNEQINVAFTIAIMVLTLAYVLYAFTACIEVSQSLGYLSALPFIPAVNPFVKVAPKPLGDDVITVVNNLIEWKHSASGGWITPNEIERVVLDECDADDYRAPCHFANLFDSEIPVGFIDGDVVGFVDDVPQLDTVGMRVVSADWFDQD